MESKVCNKFENFPRSVCLFIYWRNVFTFAKQQPLDIKLQFNVVQLQERFAVNSQILDCLKEKKQQKETRKFQIVTFLKT